MNIISKIEVCRPVGTYAFLLFFFFSNGATAQSHTQPKTMENGVILHESQGVEMYNKVDAQENPKRTIDQWSLEECVMFRDIVESKLSAESSQERIHYYREQLTIIDARIKELRNKK